VFFRTTHPPHSARRRRPPLRYRPHLFAIIVAKLRVFVILVVVILLVHRVRRLYARSRDAVGDAFFRKPEDPLLISQFSWLDLALLIPPDEDDETLAALLPETVVDGPLVTTDCPSGACDC
jgi:hypothetical protein